MDNYQRMIQLHAELALARQRAWKEEIADAEAKGEEIYYDMSAPKLVGLSDGPVMIGKWKRRKKPANHEPS